MFSLLIISEDNHLKKIPATIERAGFLSNSDCTEKLEQCRPSMATKRNYQMSHLPDSYSESCEHEYEYSVRIPIDETSKVLISQKLALYPEKIIHRVKEILVDNYRILRFKTDLNNLSNLDKLEIETTILYQRKLERYIDKTTCFFPNQFILFNCAYSEADEYNLKQIPESKSAILKIFHQELHYLKLDCLPRPLRVAFVSCASMFELHLEYEWQTRPSIQEINYMRDYISNFLTCIMTPKLVQINISFLQLSTLLSIMGRLPKPVFQSEFLNQEIVRVYHLELPKVDGQRCCFVIGPNQIVFQDPFLNNLAFPHSINTNMYLFGYAEYYTNNPAKWNELEKTKDGNFYIFQIVSKILYGSQNLSNLTQNGGELISSQESFFILRYMNYIIGKELKQLGIYIICPETRQTIEAETETDGLVGINKSLYKVKPKKTIDLVFLLSDNQSKSHCLYAEVKKADGKTKYTKIDPKYYPNFDFEKIVQAMGVGKMTFAVVECFYSAEEGLTFHKLRKKTQANSLKNFNAFIAK